MALCETVHSQLCTEAILRMKIPGEAEFSISQGDHTRGTIMQERCQQDLPDF